MENILKLGIVLFGFLSLLTLNALAISDSSNDSTKLTNNSSEGDIKLVNNKQPLYTEISGSLVGFNHTELSNRSDTIVIGTVKEIIPSKWNTADGKKSSSDVKFSLDNTIYTDIIINVDEYVKNPLSSKEVRVRVEGGTVGNDVLIVDDEPTFKPGEKVLLYLMKDDNPSTKNIGPDHFIVTGCLQGKFTLANDGKATRLDETVSKDELLSSINQTVNNTDDTEILDNIKKVNKQEGSPNSTSESKSIPFISSFWALATVLGTVNFLRGEKVTN